MFDSEGPELTAEECLSAFEATERALVQLSCHRLVLAAHWADLHPGAALPDPRTTVPGSETPWRPGGVDTPSVAGFAGAEIGCAMGSTAGAGMRLIADALDLRHRLPLTWRRVAAAEIPGHLARRAAQATRHLSAEAAARVDAEVAPKFGCLSYGRLAACLDAAVSKADPGAAEAAAEEAMRERFVRLGRASEHGLKLIIARAAAGDAIYLDAMLARLSDILAERGDADPVDVRRSKALGILARPALAMQLLFDHARPVESGTGQQSVPGEAASPLDPARARPKAVLYVHLSQEALSAPPRTPGFGVARLEGIGPVLLTRLRDVLGDGVAITVRPVIDLNDEPPAVDCYEVPERMREHLQLTNPADRFPFAAGLARSPDATCDIDHTIPYRRAGTGEPPLTDPPPGQTQVSRLGPLSRFSHRLRTHGGWQVRQPEPGTYLWRTPRGRIHLVNRSGTHPLGAGSYARALWRLATPGVALAS